MRCGGLGGGGLRDGSWGMGCLRGGSIDGSSGSGGGGGGDGERGADGTRERARGRGVRARRGRRGFRGGERGAFVGEFIFRRSWGVNGGRTRRGIGVDSR